MNEETTPMTTHETPPSPGIVTPATWRTMVEINNDVAATEPVARCETICPHWYPVAFRRWLWHYVEPIGALSPGVQAITSRSGTAPTRAAAQRRIRRAVDEAAGIDPYAATLDLVRKVALVVLTVFGMAAFVVTLDCSPAFLGVIAMAAGAVGYVAALVNARRTYNRLTAR
jgi:hypothetical protein